MKSLFTLNMLYLVLGGLLILYLVFQYGKKKMNSNFEFKSPIFLKKLSQFIEEQEGKRNRAYKDSAGFDTIGIGHKILSSEKNLLSVSLSEQEIQNLFNQDIKKFIDLIDQNVKVKLSDNQAIALISLAFNIGANAFKNSTLLKLLNEGKYNEASLQFSRWHFITISGQKIVSQGLKNRRFREQLKYNT